MEKRIAYQTLIFFILLCAGSCGDYTHPTIPNVAVDFTIYPNDPNYAPLNHYGGSMYFTGGVNGIVVYRIDYESFVAYDRACPYDWESSGSWIHMEDNGLILSDSCCGSRFSVLDGIPISGPAKLALKYYKTRYDGVRLRIYN